MRRLIYSLLVCLTAPALAWANPPVASYIFPAGGQRGAKVNVKVGGLFLHESCGFEMLGTGITAPSRLTRTKTAWFEGPILPLPDSQRQEDYPRDMAGAVSIAADTPLGLRHWRLWTSQGATPSMKFMIGELPEIVEQEIDGDAIPVKVTLPLTINGRIFPREDIDIYTFAAKKGETVRCEVHATRFSSALDARIEIRDAQARRLAEADAPVGGDPVIAFIPPADGEYQVRIQDTQTSGGQAYVYRLTLTAEPFVDRVFPLGGRRGSRVEFDLHGQAIPAKHTIDIPKDATADFPARIKVGDKHTNTFILDVDDHPEFVAARDIDKMHSFPAVLNGRIEKPGHVDAWRFHAKKGDVWNVELRAHRLGSRLDGVITIADAMGKTLAKADANPGDPSVQFAFPADGEYAVKIQDRYHTRGGSDFAYRLRVAPPPTPDFRLTLGSDGISLPRKGTAKLKLNVERLGGFKEPIQIDVQGLPAHVSITPTTIAPNQASLDLTFKAEEAAKIDVARLTIVGHAKDLKRSALLPVGRGMPAQSSVLLAVAMPTPFVIKGEYDMGFAARGGMHKRKYKIIRNGFEGPIEISLADRQARHLQGVEGPTIIVAAGVSEFTYSAFLPPWMETGRTCRVCVQGVGILKDPDGSEHRVCFSSVNQNEQLVAVVGPGMLALEADRTSFIAVPGKPFTVSIRIKRGEAITGPVEVSVVLPPHMNGILIGKTTIDAKSDRGEILITCAEKLPATFTMPVVLRATLTHAGEPLVAEIKLDVQP